MSSDGTGHVPVDDLRDLVDEWEEVYQEFVDRDSERSDGVAEGARSAAVELDRLIKKHGGADEDDGLDVARENKTPGRDNAMAAVFGRLEPCEDCGRPKSDYVDLGTHGYYQCWWCDRTGDKLACEFCNEPVPAGDYPMVSDGEQSWVFCDWTCFDRWYQDGSALDLIPVDEGRNSRPLRAGEDQPEDGDRDV